MRTLVTFSLAILVGLAGCDKKSSPPDGVSSGDEPSASSDPAKGAAAEGITEATIEIEAAPEFTDGKLEWSEVEKQLDGDYFCLEETYPSLDRAILLETNTGCKTRVGAYHLVDTTSGEVLATFGTLQSASAKAGYLVASGYEAVPGLMSTDRKVRRAAARQQALISMKNGSVYPNESMTGLFFYVHPATDRLFAFDWDRETDQSYWGILDAPPKPGEEVKLSWEADDRPRPYATGRMFDERPNTLFVPAGTCHRLALPLDGGEAKCEARFPKGFLQGVDKLSTYDYLVLSSNDARRFEAISLGDGEKTDITPDDCPEASARYPGQLDAPRVFFTCWKEGARYREAKSQHVWTPEGTYEIPNGPFKATPTGDRLLKFYKLKMGLGGKRAGDRRWFDLVSLRMFDGVDELERVGAWGAHNQLNLTKRADNVVYHVDIEGPRVRKLDEFNCPGSVGLTHEADDSIGYFCAGEAKPSPQDDCSETASVSAVAEAYVYDLANARRYRPEHPVVGATDNALVAVDSPYFVSLKRPCKPTKVWVAARK